MIFINCPIQSLYHFNLWQKMGSCNLAKKVNRLDCSQGRNKNGRNVRKQDLSCCPFLLCSHSTFHGSVLQHLLARWVWHPSTTLLSFQIPPVPTSTNSHFKPLQRTLIKCIFDYPLHLESINYFQSLQKPLLWILQSTQPYASPHTLCSNCPK